MLGVCHVASAATTRPFRKTGLLVMHVRLNMWRVPETGKPIAFPRTVNIYHSTITRAHESRCEIAPVRNRGCLGCAALRNSNREYDSNIGQVFTEGGFARAEAARIYVPRSQFFKLNQCKNLNTSLKYECTRIN